MNLTRAARPSRFAAAKTTRYHGAAVHAPAHLGHARRNRPLSVAAGSRARRARLVETAAAWRIGRRAVAGARSTQFGRASYYSGAHTTADGGHVGAATCASRTLPFGTKVLVTNLANARRMVLTVNDRGPFVGGRIVDVSRGAAGQLGMMQAGVAAVRVEVIARR